ncbi:MAG: ribosome silencing factor [Candidatus Puniceispirillaceae bacterium]
MSKIDDELTPHQVKDIITSSLEDDKAIDIVSISLSGKSSMADFMVIASGNSSRQVAAMADHLERALKQNSIDILGKEGVGQADWVLLDTAEVIVHLFRPEVREFYQLEKMWDKAAGEDVVHISAES